MDETTYCSTCPVPLIRAEKPYGQCSACRHFAKIDAEREQSHDEQILRELQRT